MKNKDKNQEAQIRDLNYELTTKTKEMTLDFQKK